jgi:hypothetical protein
MTPDEAAALRDDVDRYASNPEHVEDLVAADLMCEKDIKLKGLGDVGPPRRLGYTFFSIEEYEPWLLRAAAYIRSKQ